jgi:hypothetical protein
MKIMAFAFFFLFATSALAQCCSYCMTLNGVDRYCPNNLGTNNGCTLGSGNTCQCANGAGSCFTSNAACVNANCPPPLYQNYYVYSDSQCLTQVGTQIWFNTCSSAAPLGTCMAIGTSGYFRRQECSTTVASTNGWPSVCKHLVFVCCF